MLLRAGWMLAVTWLAACGGAVVFEEAGEGSGGAAGTVATTSAGEPSPASGAVGPATTSAGGGAGSSVATASEVSAGPGGGGPGPGGGEGGGDVVREACARFCEAHGDPCRTFEGDCRRDCALVAATYGCEREWIDVVSCLAEEDVTCVDVSACDGPIDVWNACLEA